MACGWVIGSPSSATIALLLIRPAMSAAELSVVRTLWPELRLMMVAIPEIVSRHIERVRVVGRRPHIAHDQCPRPGGGGVVLHGARPGGRHGQHDVRGEVSTGRTAQVRPAVTGGLLAAHPRPAPPERHVLGPA